MSSSPLQTFRQGLKAWLEPVARFYIRHCPGSFLKAPLYEAFFWNYRDFAARTVFGSRVTGNTKDLIQRFIYYFGIWEPAQTHWLKRTLQPGDVFVDVGANIGYYTLLGSRCVGETGQVIAIEASPSIYALLCANVRTNRERNINTMNCAAGDVAGEIAIYKAAAENIGQSSTLAWTDHAVFEAKVPVKPLCDLIPDHQIAAVRVVKIDVEGAEYRVLQGMLPLIRNPRFQGDIAVELTPKGLAQCGVTYQDVQMMLGEYGFKPFVLPNSYNVCSYIAPQGQPAPQPYHDVPASQVDLVFSRRDQP